MTSPGTGRSTGQLMEPIWPQKDCFVLEPHLSAKEKRSIPPPLIVVSLSGEEYSASLLFGVPLYRVATHQSKFVLDAPSSI